MRKSWQYRLGLLVVAGLSTLSLTGTMVASAASAKPKLDPNATVRFSSTATVSQWDPTRSSNQNSDYVYFTQVYDRLIQLKTDTTLGPALATSWSFSPDGLSLTMQLRKDVKYHDGGSFDAANAAANLNRNRASGILASTLTAIRAVSAVDQSTIRLDLVKNDPTVLYRLATTSSSMVSPAGLANPSSLTAKPAGSGPYKFVSFSGTTVTLESNTAYWDKSRTYAPKKTMTGLSDDTARLNAVKSGITDIANTRPTQFPDVQQMVKSKQFKLTQIPSLAQYIVYLNGKTGPLSNPVVRQAISMAIDRKTISDTVLNGACPPSRQLIPKGFVGYVKSDDRNIFNVKKATEMLKSAGVGPITLNALVGVEGIYNQLGTIVQDQLKQIGITMNVRLVPITALRSTWRGGGADLMVLQNAPPSPDAINLLDGDYLGVDALGAPMATLQSMVEEARPLPVGSKARATALQKINHYLNENPLHILLCQNPALLVTQPKLAGLDDLVNSRLSGDVHDSRFLYIAKSGK